MHSWIKSQTRIFLFTVLGIAGAFGQGVIDIPGIERRSGNPTYPIAILSGDEDVSALTRRAFQVHGAFNVVSRDQAAVTVQLERMGTNWVNLTIFQGSGSQVSLQEVVSGSSLTDAVYRACDVVVARVAGLPGIFAGKLAFVGERTGYKEIYTGDLFFQQYRAVTQDRSESISPRWSPDGTQILYTGYFRSGFPEIYVLNTVARSREIIARYQGTNTGATFSPDGRRIAMILSSPGNPELYLADMQGKQPMRMTFNNSLEASPDFSPQGDRLVLTSDAIGVPQIYIMELSSRSRNNSGMRRIARNVSRNISEPAWNPQGEEIAFTLVQGSNFQIGLYNLNTDEVEVLTQGRYDSVEPTWTRDGRHLLYTRRTGDRSELRIMDKVTKRSYPLHTSRVGDTSQANYIYP